MPSELQSLKSSLLGLLKEDPLRNPLGPYPDDSGNQRGLLWGRAGEVRKRNSKFKHLT